jgi:2-dehydropantoate 2-reductase
MGAGGVGALIGGRLAIAGADVMFIARGAHLAALREHGLTIESAELGDTHLREVTATDDPARIGVTDFVILAVKLWDTEAAAGFITPLVGPDTAVLSLQNGVVKDEILRREFGSAAVMGGVAYLASAISRPGVIRQTGTLQKIVLGEYDGRKSPRAESLGAALMGAGIEVELSADILKATWEKYVFLVGLSGATTAMRVPIGTILSNLRATEFLLQLMQETVAVGRANGVGLAEDYPDDRVAFARRLPPNMMASMYHDLDRGNRLEVNWLSGGVVELGEQLGVVTPANRAVCSILAVHQGGRPRT